jgi:hypothetical protein
MKTNKSFRSKLAVGAAVVALFISSLACDEGPNPVQPCGNACGITSPVTEVENMVIEAIAPDAQNTLSGGN